MDTDAVFTPTLTESLSMIDTVDTDAAFTTTLTESLSMNDTVNTDAAFTTTLTESFTINDTVNTDAVFTTTLTESFSMNDTLDTDVASSTTLSESFSMNDTVAAAATHRVTLSESLSMNDTVDTDAVFTTTLSESFSMNDLVVRVLPGVPSAEVSLSGWILDGCTSGNSNDCLDEAPGTDDGTATMIKIGNADPASSRYTFDDFGIPPTNIIDSVTLHVIAAAANGGTGKQFIMNVTGPGTTSCLKTLGGTSFSDFTCLADNQSWVPADFDGQTTIIGVDNAGTNVDKERRITAMYLDVVHHPNLIVTLVESLSINDTVNPDSVFTPTLSESFSMSDTVNTDAVFTPTLEESFSINDDYHPRRIIFHK